MSKAPPTFDHKWNADRPIERPEDDKLGRKETAMAFLRATLNQIQASGHRGTRTIYKLDASYIAQFADLKSLAEAAASAAGDHLDQATLQKLRTAPNSSPAGKPIPAIYILTRDEDGKFVYDQSDSTI